MSTAATLSIVGSDGPTEADEKFGYEFGCDGLVSRDEACQLLGGVSVDTLEDLYRENKIRKGKMPGRRVVGICRRSLRNYIRSMEL